MTFDFEPDLTAAQNIEKFHKHMETIDAELASLLRAQLPTVLPLPENNAQKAAVRQKFNETVLKHLDRPNPTK